MARTRKQWLETFIGLADKGAAAIEYRKRLRIKSAPLQVLIKKLTKFRHELNEIVEQEEAVKKKEIARANRLKAAEAARRKRREELERRSSDEAID